MSPLAANIYLNDLDWLFDDIRCKTADNGYEAVNYHRFADDIVIPVSGHHTKNAWAERALQRLQQHLIPLGVSLNTEKTKIVNLLDGESFGFLGFDFRRVQNRKKSGYFICMTPGKKARKAIKARIRTIITSGGSVSSKDIVARIKRVLGGGGAGNGSIDTAPVLYPTELFRLVEKTPEGLSPDRTQRLRPDGPDFGGPDHLSVAGHLLPSELPGKKSPSEGSDSCEPRLKMSCAGCQMMPMTCKM